MGYCMNLQEAAFEWKSGDEADILAAIKDTLYDAETRQPKLASAGGWRWGGGSLEPEARWYAWVDNEAALKAQTLDDFLKEWGWVLQDYNTEFLGEKIGNDLDLFEAIAPFVEAGSYIEMRGEEGALWRWVFDGEKVVEKSATIVWE